MTSKQQNCFSIYVVPFHSTFKVSFYKRQLVFVDSIKIHKLNFFHQTKISNVHRFQTKNKIMQWCNVWMCHSCGNCLLLIPPDPLWDPRCVENRMRLFHCLINTMVMYQFIKPAQILAWHVSNLNKHFCWCFFASWQRNKQDLNLTDSFLVDSVDRDLASCIKW